MTDMTQKLYIRHVKTYNEISLIRLEGKIDFDTSPMLKAFINRLITQDKNSIILDFSRILFIDSYAISSLISQIKESEKNGGFMKFIGINNPIKRVLSILQVHELFEQYDTEKEALNSIQKPELFQERIRLPRRFKARHLNALYE